MFLVKYTHKQHYFTINEQLISKMSILVSFDINVLALYVNV